MTIPDDQSTSIRSTLTKRTRSILIDMFILAPTSAMVSKFSEVCIRVAVTAAKDNIMHEVVFQFNENADRIPSIVEELAKELNLGMDRGGSYQIGMNSSFSYENGVFDIKKTGVPPGNKILKYKGAFIWLSVSEIAREGTTMFSSSRTMKSISLRVLKKNASILNDLVKQSGARSMAQPPGIFHLPNTYSQWERLCLIPNRSFESLAIPDALIQDWVFDYNHWLQTEAECNRIGRPWRRTYRLKGIAGSGKTSFIRAVGHYTGRDIYFLQGAASMDSHRFWSTMMGTPEGSIVVIEDYDAIQSTQEDRDVIGQNATSQKELNGEIKDASGPDKSVLLNTLDGIAPLQNRILILTTNVPHMDPAVERAGRIDRDFTFGCSEDPEIRKYLSFFFKIPKDTLPTTKFSPLPGSILQKVCEHYRRVSDDGSMYNVNLPECFVAIQKAAEVYAQNHEIVKSTWTFDN